MMWQEPRLLSKVYSHTSATASAQGIRDNDNGLRRNYGYMGNRAISIDVGSFVLDDSLKDPVIAQIELERKTKQLGQWLTNEAPELLPYFNEELQSSLINRHCSHVKAPAVERS
ncbi:MAG: hypothetical protein LVR00_01060 [Rhabdochlamydiaceae bacterium]|jgi:hypothetical protein